MKVTAPPPNVQAYPNGEAYLWFLVTFLSTLLGLAAFQLTPFYESHLHIPEHGYWLHKSLEKYIPLFFVGTYCATITLMFFNEKKGSQKWALGCWSKTILQVGVMIVTYFEGEDLKNVFSVISFFSLVVTITGLMQLYCAMEDYGTMDGVFGIVLSVVTHYRTESWAVFLLSFILISTRNFSITTPSVKVNQHHNYQHLQHHTFNQDHIWMMR